MENYENILKTCPHSFVVIEIDEDNIIIDKYNINKSEYSETLIKEIQSNIDIRGFIVEGMKGQLSEYSCKIEKDTFKFTLSRLNDNKAIIWVIKEQCFTEVDSMNFLSSLTHEFKTPLNIIFSSLQLINKKLEAKKSVSKNEMTIYMDMIKQNSYRILKLINNIADDNKLELGYLELNPTNENIVYFVENVCDSTNDYAKSNNMQIVFDTDIEELIVSFDQEKIERVLLNLISNAIKFRKECNGLINIKIEYDKDYVHIKVRDNGIGIDKNKLQYIFTKYVRLNNKKSMVKEGSGIGLSLVDSIIKAHEGIISVDSVVDEWTEFKISIPNKKRKESRCETLDCCIQDKEENLKIEFCDI